MHKTLRSYVFVPIFFFGLLAAVGFSGCSGQPQTPRGEFVTVSEIVAQLYMASAQLYADCHNKAGEDRAAQDKCYEEKNARGDKLEQAIPYLDAAGGALIAYNGQDPSGNLDMARAIINSLQAALQGYVNPDQATALGWMEGGPRP